MYTCIHRVYMWEAEPRLYWRLKVNGKWTWKAAVLVDRTCCGYLKPEPPTPEVNESE